jgi:peptidoglycan/LPS O-acetylase OafA/YrhL
VTVAHGGNDFSLTDNHPSGHEAGNRIKSLDGIRAIAVCMVLISHSVNQPGISLGWLSGTLGETSVRLLGRFGVFLFFVLSGYLITTLLLREKQKTGVIDLRRFWIRRALRIFPIFYTYILVIGLLIAFAKLLVDPLAIAFAATCTLNYAFLFSSQSLGEDYAIIGHFWTLAVEEQFYLFFPILVSYLSREAAFKATLILILITPSITVATYLLMPTSHQFTSIMGHNVFGVSIALGCLSVISQECGRLVRFRGCLATPLAALAGLIYGIVMYPWLAETFGGYAMTIGGELLLGLSSLAIIAYSVECPVHSQLSRMLNNRSVVSLGMLSYSIYVWHQLPMHFKIPNVDPLVSNLIAGVVSIGLAVLSYYFLETPFLNLRDRFRIRERLVIT